MIRRCSSSASAFPGGRPCNTQTMAYQVGEFPKNAIWAAFGIGRNQFPMVAQAVLLGGHVRVGLEDNLYLEKGVYASNGTLTERAVKIIEILGTKVASPDEARDILQAQAAEVVMHPHGSRTKSKRTRRHRRAPGPSSARAGPRDCSCAASMSSPMTWPPPPKPSSGPPSMWPGPRCSSLLSTAKVKKGKLSFTTDLEGDGIEELISSMRRRPSARTSRSSSSGISTAMPGPMSSSPPPLRASCRPGCNPNAPHPERVIIGHPFNPVYLLPLVETVPGEKTSPEAMDRAGKYFESIGMHVLRLKKEIDGYICDRLQEALWREALHILDKDIGTTGDIDDSIVYSAGMRWAFMGSFLTYHAGGRPRRHARTSSSSSIRRSNFPGPICAFPNGTTRSRSAWSKAARRRREARPSPRSRPSAMTCWST